MTGLDFTRGLFRLWVVISGLWLAAVAGAYWMETPVALVKPGAVYVPECAGKTQHDCSDLLNREGRNPYLAFVAEGYAEPPPPQRSPILPYVMGAVIPPLLLLVLGLIARWVIRGFRASG